MSYLASLAKRRVPPGLDLSELCECGHERRVHGTATFEGACWDDDGNADDCHLFVPATDALLSLDGPVPAPRPASAQLIEFTGPTRAPSESRIDDAVGDVRGIIAARRDRCYGALRITDDQVRELANAIVNAFVADGRLA